MNGFVHNPMQFFAEDTPLELDTFDVVVPAVGCSDRLDAYETIEHLSGNLLMLFVYMKFGLPIYQGSSYSLLPLLPNLHCSPDDDDCLYYHSWRNNVVSRLELSRLFLPSFNEWRCLRCLSFCR